METDLNKYYCINCGTQVRNLFKKYSSTVLKLTDCNNCHNITDKYVEYDIIIIIIDLVLLRKIAYRHVLFNAEFKNFWKLSVTFLLVESYTEWVLKSPKSYIRNVDEKGNDLEIVDMEVANLQFYKIFLKMALRSLCFIACIFFLTRIYSKVLHRPIISVKMIWKTITVSSFGMLLFLPSLIWDVNVQEFHLSVVSLYTMLAQLLAFTVICNCSKFWSIIVIFVSYYFKSFVVDLCDLLNTFTYPDYINKHN